jgi:DNA-binding transcriptional regulator LsrR (DeoR family)
MPPSSAEVDRLRMMTKVARLYHSRGMVQTEIANALGLSQARVSRLLSAASEANIIRTVVVVPDGLNADLEEQVEDKFGLVEVHVVDTAGESDHELNEVLGATAASVFQVMPIEGKKIGFTSWSRSLRSLVTHLQKFQHASAQSIVEMLGGVGPPSVQHGATTATERLSQLAGAEPLFLRVPGVTATPEIRNAILESDPHARLCLENLSDLDVALVGIGNCEIVAPLVAGDNFFSEAQFAKARSLGAVGEINLHFINEFGDSIDSEFDDLVIGVTREQLMRTARRIGVAGGASKHAAILGAVRGGWVNLLVTDSETARYLLEQD